MSKSSTVLLSSHYINAYGLVRGLQRVGYEGDLVAIKPAGDGVSLLEACFPTIRMLAPTDQDLGSFSSWLAQRLPNVDDLTIFFADERLLPLFQQEKETPSHATKPARMTLHSAFDCDALDQVLDRFRFYDLIQSKDLAEVPRSIDGGEDPTRKLGYPFMVRPKRSWRGVEKLPRVRLVENSLQWREVRQEFEAWGITDDELCYQEVLSISDKHNVSVCGWHDSVAPIHHLTRKVLQHPPKTGNGDVVETVNEPEDLLTIAAKVLDALNYRGPFELEFVLDTRSGRYHVIELNPRFWMQHELMNALYDNELIHRALGKAPRSLPRPRKRAVWINTIYGLYRLLRGQRGMIRHVYDATVLSPTVADTLRWMPQLGGRMVKERLSKVRKKG